MAGSAYAGLTRPGTGPFLNTGMRWDSGSLWVLSRDLALQEIMDKIDLSAFSFISAQVGTDRRSAELKGRGSPVDAKRAREGSGLNRKSIFSELMENSAAAAGGLGPLYEVEPSEEALTELMDAVHSTGSDLKDRPFPGEILQYKRAVRNFMHYIVENGYEIHKLQGIKKKTLIRGETEWKATVYHQVRVVDQKLEELAAAILSGQANQLERVAKMEEISGLLVDLTITGAIRERNG